MKILLFYDAETTQKVVKVYINFSYNVAILKCFYYKLEKKNSCRIKFMCCICVNINMFLLYFYVLNCRVCGEKKINITTLKKKILTLQIRNVLMKQKSQELMKTFLIEFAYLRGLIRISRSLHRQVWINT